MTSQLREYETTTVVTFAEAFTKALQFHRPMAENIYRRALGTVAELRAVAIIRHYDILTFKENKAVYVRLQVMGNTHADPAAPTAELTAFAFKADPDRVGRWTEDLATELLRVMAYRPWARDTPRYPTVDEIAVALADPTKLVRIGRGIELLPRQLSPTL